jgi:multidrug resistance efflux pump
MNEHHEPRPEFVSHLEWQLRTALQREDRFSEPTKPKLGGKMNMGALVLVSALMGAGGVVVTEEVQDAKAQEIRIAQAEGRMEMAALELEIIRAQADRVEELYSVGSVVQEAVLEGSLQMAEGEVRYMKLALDLEEIRLSGTDPNPDLSAPLVDGRDFVSERLTFDLKVAQEWLSLSEYRVGRYRELFGAGVVNQESLAQAELALEEAEIGLQSLGSQLDLRHRFLAGGISPSEAKREAEIQEASQGLQHLDGLLDASIIRLQAFEERVDAGLVHESELRQARLEVMRVEMEIELARMRLEQLRVGQSGP